MAISIAQGFQKLKGNLEITTLQADTVSTRQQNIRSVVQSDVDAVDDFLTGSYIRNTMIGPLSEADVDIMIILDNRYFYNYTDGKNGGQAGLLDLLKRTLRKTYTRTPDISRNGQAVTIRFEDFQVDVVPGFHRDGGGYLIPNSKNQNWISTDPKKHVEIFSQANTVHNGDFVPLVKMIKAWNRQNGAHFISFHMETMALQVLTNVNISDFPSGMRFFFDKAREKVKYKNADPAGPQYNPDIGNYIGTPAEIDEAVKRFQKAFDVAAKAEDYERRGYTSSALQQWKSLFGDHFPIS